MQLRTRTFIRQLFFDVILDHFFSFQEDLAPLIETARCLQIKGQYHQQISEYRI
jgi:hypothetical protein